MKTKSTYQRVYDCVTRYKNRTGNWPTIREVCKCIKVGQSDVIRVAMASSTLDYTKSGSEIWDWVIEVIANAEPDCVSIPFPDGFRRTLTTT